MGEAKRRGNRDQRIQQSLDEAQRERERIAAEKLAAEVAEAARVEAMSEEEREAYFERKRRQRRKQREFALTLGTFMAVGGLDPTTALRIVE
jgi:hypothetical protein